MFNKPPRYETNDQHKRSERYRKLRRGIANTAAGTVITLTALLGTDEALGAHEPTETKLVIEYPEYFTGDNTESLTPEESIISYELPGFNADSKYVDNQVGPILDKYGTRIKVVYGDDLSIDTVAGSIAEQLEAGSDTQPVVLYGHSLGGNVSIRVIAELIEKYGFDPSRFAVILDCTPASNGDVNTDLHQGFIDFLDIVSYTPLDGGPISRFTAETINALADGADPIAAIERGWKNKAPKPQENSNAVVIAQAHILKDQQALIHAANVLKKHNVPVAFIAPAQIKNEDAFYRNDGIVHNKTANTVWKERFGEDLTDYLVTEKNLHGIQVRNKDLYVDHIDSFLGAQGIDPYQPDIIEPEETDKLINANEPDEQDSPDIQSAEKQPLLDPVNNGNPIDLDSGDSTADPTER